MTVRLMTYNVHRCVGVDRKLDIDRVADVIAACRPDVVALQELDVGRARTRGVDQALAAIDEAPRNVKFLRGAIDIRGGHWREVGAHQIAAKMSCLKFRSWFLSDRQCKSFDDRLLERLALPEL